MPFLIGIHSSLMKVNCLVFREVYIFVSNNITGMVERTERTCNHSKRL